LKILMAASEAAPFVRTGGLGDVMGALPEALAAAGHEVKVIIPRYGSIDGHRYRFHPVLDPFAVVNGTRSNTCALEKAELSHAAAEYYFVVSREYFDRPDLYIDPGTGKDFVDNHLRFSFFSRAVLESVRRLNWRPDLVHVHDWQAALIPLLLQTTVPGDRFFESTASVMTIHNLGYQGLFEGKYFAELGLSKELFYAATGPLEFFGRVNFLKAGIVAANKVTTVSHRYATEIRTSEELGCGLMGVLAHRSADLVGILNGVDYSIWSPSRDKLIPFRYGLANLSGKRMSRVELLREAGLPIRERAPVIGFVGRLTEQKGIDLIVEGADRLMAMDLQLILLGAGEETHRRRLEALEGKYPDKVKLYYGFDDALAHRIQSGADMLLMPSRYEPCGLNQMYALRYGTVPIVREVGGLADTVTDYNVRTGGGTGFVFSEYKSEALVAAVERAVELFGRRQKWTKLMKAGMREDFSWHRSAAQYAGVYESARTSQPAAQSRI